MADLNVILQCRDEFGIGLTMESESFHRLGVAANCIENPARRLISFSKSLFIIAQ
ncbi:MAG: hypothetical protein ABI273_00885 [Lacunisphaera sp.]